MNKRNLLLSGVVILLLRFLGIWHDYPYSFYPDEAHFVKRALSFGSFDFNPHWFHKPAFYMYLLFLNYGLLFVFGKITSLWSSASDFAVFYILNPGPFYIIGRVITALFGVATIYLTYRIGEKFFRKNAGVAAAILLTLCYGHVSAGQDIKADIPAAFFATLSVWFLLNYNQNSSDRYIFLAAFFAGMGAATKIYPMLMMPAVLLSLVFPGEKNPYIRQGAAKILTLAASLIAVFWGAYFICSPYSFLDPLGRESVFSNFVTLWEKISALFSGTTVTEKPAWVDSQPTSLFQSSVSYLLTLFNYKGMGIPIASISISGLLYLITKRDGKNLLFLLFPFLLALFSIYTAPGYAEPRHQVPLYPFLTIAGGVLIAETAGRERTKKKIIYGLLSVTLLWPLFNLIETGILNSKTDTRNIAKHWIEENIPPGTKILANENGPVLLAGEKSLRKSLEKAKKADSSGQFTAHYGQYLEYQLEAAGRAVTYDITEIRHPWWRDSEPKEGVSELSSDYDRDMANHLRPVGVNSYDHYVKNGYQYAIVHSEEYLRYMRPGAKKAKKFPSFFRFYTELFSRGKLIKEFLPEKDNRPGPIVKIFRF